MKTILVSGAAGFIGMHVADALLARGDRVVGIDNLNRYYAVELKRARLAHLRRHAAFRFERVDVADMPTLSTIFEAQSFDAVVHLAAQAGVRYSVTHPHSYAQSNLVGFLNILEACRHARTGHLVYASSSSVYGGNLKMPFAETDNVDRPVSLYAATKKANELMAHSYSHLYGLPTSGLRFFTVYGPWGRPDMAPVLFARSILAGEPIRVFNHGQMSRDFTYVDDIVAGVLAVLDAPPAPQAESPPYRVMNLGSESPVPLMRFIGCLEQALGRKATLDLQPMQPGDVPATYADVSALRELMARELTPTPLVEGIQTFVDWYRTRGWALCHQEAPMGSLREASSPAVYPQHHPIARTAMRAAATS